MSGFTCEALEKKLLDLNNSQQSIQTLSLWLIHHRKHHKSIVQTWFKELKKVKPNRKLTFMYLANDVIQNSRKKGPEFSKEFGSVLKNAFENVAKDSDEKTFGSLDRILSIWEARSIYDTNQMNAFTQALAARRNTMAKPSNANNANNANSANSANNTNTAIHNETSKQVKEKKEHKKEMHNSDKVKEREHRKREHHIDSNKAISSKRQAIDANFKKSTTHNQMKQKTVQNERSDNKTLSGNTSTVVMVDPEVLIKALQELENSASSDAGVREKIASLPPEVSDATLLDKIRDKGAAERLSKLVDEACSILADYNSRLSQELEDRKHISSLLSNYTQNQRDSLALAEQKLGEYKDKLRKVTQVRNELKSHLQNLPDLSRLPSVTGLAPLPSALDLFNVARIKTSAGSVTSSVSPNESNASPADYDNFHGTPSSNTS